MTLRSALATLLAFALLWWFLRGVDLQAVWAQVRSAHLGLLAVAVAGIVATYVTRVIRWQYLLAPVGPTRFRTALRTTVIGFAALSVLPARVGDLLRPYLLARQEGLEPSATMATVVMERVLDLLAVITLLALFVWVLADPSAMPAGASREMAVVKVTAATSGVIAVVLVGLMWVLATHPERIGALVLFCGRVFPRRIAERLARFARVFSSGFAAARSPRHLLLATLWSFPVWLSIAAEAWAVTRAFGIVMPFSGSYLVQALLVLGVAVPTPAGVGSYHAAYRYGVTTFFGAPESQAVGAALVLHAISFVPIVFVGILFMAQDGLSVGQLRTLASQAREKERPDTDEMPVLRSSGR
jgi:uncharacterized protein (TIRG00374 family)